MSNSIREQILQAVAGILSPVAMEKGATFLRSPVIGVPREASPALLLFPESESILERPNDRVERALVLRIVALVREGGSQTPEALADELVVAAHAALFANANLDGFALGVKELDCEWDLEDADAAAVTVVQRYQITYRTCFDDLTQQG